MNITETAVTETTVTETTIEFEGYALAVEIDTENDANVYQDDVWAATGRWDPITQALECSALICGEHWEAAYEALDAALIEAGA